jgi:hypothetical protein
MKRLSGLCDRINVRPFYEVYRLAVVYIVLMINYTENSMVSG